MNILPANDVENFVKFSQEVVEKFEEKQRTEALLYVEVPDKYLDPLLN